MQHPGVFTIVVADDDPLIRETVSSILENHGYNVLVAAHGGEAISLINQHDAMLLITDLIMPETEGIETISVLSATHPDLKIIAMSGSGEHHRAYLNAAASMGAAEVLSKPFTATDLLEMVHSALYVD